MAARSRFRSSSPAAKPPAKVESDLRAMVLNPIITMNAIGVIQSASDSVEQVFGWTPSELFGRNMKSLIPEPRRSALDRYLDRYRRSDRGKSLERSRRFEAVRKDGSVFEIELSISRADLPSHSAPYFIGIVRDVSQQIEVVGGELDERTRLQELLTAQTRALATANLRLLLSDRMAALGTLAAGMGHDMNNVLLPVRARLNALEHAGITPAAQAHVAALRRSIAYLQHLSDGLHFLTLDPEGAGAAEGKDATTDLLGWWRQVGALLRKAVPEHVRFESSIPAGLPLVQTAPHWLTQAALNMIVNAGEAIPKGRRTGRVRLWARSTADGGVVRLGVTDNGRGMTAEVQARAFDLFFTTKPRGVGTGLGLPLVRRVASRAGGDVEVTSSPGKGTTVVLVLPAAAVDAATRSGRREGQLSASVSIQEPRLGALVAQILQASGVHIRSSDRDEPGRSDLWVTKPTLHALAEAKRWKARDARRVVALLGEPSASTKTRWEALGAVVVPRGSHFAELRHAMGEAMEKLSAAHTPDHRS